MGLFLGSYTLGCQFNGVCWFVLLLWHIVQMILVGHKNVGTLLYRQEEYYALYIHDGSAWGQRFFFSGAF